MAKNVKEDEEGKLAWLVIFGTLPAGLIGFVFEKAGFGSKLRSSVGGLHLPHR